MAPTPRQRRAPLSELPNGQQSPLADALRTMNSEVVNDHEKSVIDLTGGKRTAAELNAADGHNSITIPMYEPTESPRSNKKSRRSSTRRSNRKVSFGGQQIKLYSRHDGEWESPKPVRKSTQARLDSYVPSPRRSRRLSVSSPKQTSGKDESDGDTLTLPEAPDIPHVPAPDESDSPGGSHFRDDQMQQSPVPILQDVRANIEPQADDLFVDEDVTMSGQPRLSTAFGAGDDTTMRLSLSVRGLPQDNDSVSPLESDGDITVYMQPLGALVDNEEEEVMELQNESEGADVSPSQLSGIVGGIPRDSPEVSGKDVTLRMIGDSRSHTCDSRTDEDAPLQTKADGGNILKATEAERDVADNTLSPLPIVRASPSPSARESIGDITSHIPQLSNIGDQDDTLSPLPIMQPVSHPSVRESIGDVTSHIPPLSNLYADEEMEAVGGGIPGAEDKVQVHEGEIQATKLAMEDHERRGQATQGRAQGKSGRVHEPHLPPSRAKPPLRPTLPESRRLFNSDAAPDEEDTTLHFYDNGLPLHTRPEPQVKLKAVETPVHALQDTVVKASDLPEVPTTVLSAAVPSTPQSATGSKIRAAVEARSSANRGTEAVSKLRELSASAPRSTKLKSLKSPVLSSVGLSGEVPGQALVESSPLAEQLADSLSIASEQPAVRDFRIADFLAASTVNFEGNLLRGREESLGLGLSGPSESQRVTLEGRILDSVRKSAILRRLEDEVSSVQNKIEISDKRICSLEGSIESLSPPLFATMRDMANLPSDVLTRHQLELKRLRKVCALRARQEWVQYRHEWEGGIGESVKKCTASLQHDVVILQSSTNGLSNLEIGMSEEFQGLGLNRDTRKVLDGPDSNSAIASLQQAVREEFGFVTDLREYLSTKQSSKQTLSQEKESLLKRRSSLSAVCNNLQGYADADSSVKLKCIASERSERNIMISRATSIAARCITSKDVMLDIAGLMNLHISLDGSDIRSIECTPGTPALARTSEVLRSYIDGAVGLVDSECLQQVQTLSSLPLALQVSAEVLTRAKLAFADAYTYFDGHLGETVSSAVTWDGGPSLDLTVMASFYSLQFRWKFDLSITVSTVLSSQGFSRQTFTLDNIEKFIGDCPSEEELCAVLTTRGFARSASVFSFSDAFGGVWDML